MSLLPIFSEIDQTKSVSHSSTVNSGNNFTPPRQAAAPKQVNAEPPQERPVTRKVVARGAYSTPSILDALKDEPQTVEGVRKAATDSNPNYKSDDVIPFSQQELVETWKNFVATIEAPQLKSALGAREPLLTDKWQVEYELDTELQLNRLTLDLKPKLLGHLRRQFKNEGIEILFKVSVASSSQPHIPYTDGERWNVLTEKYPALAALKSKFGLDFDHF